MLGIKTSRNSEIISTTAFPVFDFMNSSFLTEKTTDVVPRAFLNYVLMDNNLQVQRDKNGDPLIDIAQVSDAAKIPAGDHELLQLTVRVKKEGYIYTYLSNDDKQNVEVYFPARRYSLELAGGDDFRIKHKFNDIVSGGDYYPYGSVMAGRQITRDDYRFGYQGQFSEYDEETGWNAFELRMYDSKIGRWLSVDPAGQYWSPYLGMGNRPTSLVDPDGAFDTRAGAFLYKITHGGGRIVGEKGNYRVVKTLNDGDPSKGIMNSVEIVTGRQSSDDGPGFFDTVSNLLQDDLGTMVWGNGGDYVGFYNQATGQIVSLELEELINIVSPIMKDFKPSMVKVNNNNRTVTNPEVGERTKRVVEAAVEAIKAHGEVHYKLKPNYLKGPRGTVFRDSIPITGPDTFSLDHIRGIPGWGNVDSLYNELIELQK